MGAQASKQPRNVLLVDDEPSMTKVISRLLALNGYTATIASDAPNALELVRERGHEFCSVITDLSMPGISGDELARQMKALAPLLPIVLSTGGGDGAEGLYAGMLPKPFDHKTLVDIVERHSRDMS